MNHPTAGEWKSEIVGTSSGRWIRIYVDDDRYEDGHELFESATVQISSGRAKRRWKDTQEADGIRANVALVLAAKALLAELKRAVAFIGETQEYKTGHTGAGSILTSGNAVISSAEGK